MKLLKSSLLITISFLLFSCSDSEVISEEIPTKPFYVKIDGSEFVAATLNVGLVTDKQIAIEAINANDISLVMGFTIDVEAGDELKAGLFNTTTSELFVPVYDIEENGFYATEGTLKIISHDKTIKNISGRFSFNGINPDDVSKTINFTEGEFNVTY